MDAAEIVAPSDRTSLKAAFAALLPGRKPSPAEAEFIDRLLDDYREDELPGWPPEALAGLFAELKTLGETAAPEGSLKLDRAGTDDAAGRPLDLLSLAHPDIPFVVESVMGELAQQGLDVRAMFHSALESRVVMLVVLGAVGEDRREALLAGIEATLADVRAAVEDFPPILALMREAIDELERSPPRSDPAQRTEQIEFLRWLSADRFVFLGARVYTFPRDAQGEYLREQPAFDQKGSLGVLRDPERGVLRRASEPAVLSASPRAWLDKSPSVAVAKSNLRSRVHRRVYMDYVAVRRYGAEGVVTGEYRFVGLFTADAYEEPAHTLPLLRRKVERVLARMVEGRGEHSERRLRHIVESYPRDELYQIEEDELLEIALGILHLYDRPRVRLFTRKDPFDRFASALLFVPRDHYDSELQSRAGAILAEAYKGRLSAVYPSFSDGPLARMHFIIGLNPGEAPDPDSAALEARLVEAVRTWGDRFEAALREGDAPDGGVGPVLMRWRRAFPAGYRDHNDAADALADLACIDSWAEGPPVKVRAFRRAGDGEARFRFKLYVREAPAPLSDVLPILEHMGLRVLEESGFPLAPAGEEAPVWAHEYLLADARGKALDFDDVDGPFGETFVAVWTGRAESDGFNRLVLEIGASWRQAALVRALARWRQQTGLDPSQAVQEASLRDHPGVARLIIDLFGVKFDPAIHASLEQRRELMASIEADIEFALQQVESLDADRVLRRLANTVSAMVRTNYYQLDEQGAPKAHLSFKVDPRAVPELPAPRPYREVFVASPRVEGVHLRFGPVARGGLRWSDRRDDYRTEVLGLVKAQQVKNAVIVPVGAKGGFYPKQLPREGGPPAIRAEAIEAYKVYLAGLLDLTDNLDDAGKIVRPAGIVAHDAEDPYLVVAADKGTATFSDIANGVAIARDFWLGDAFASGGSAGYDHKAMGITARGAWEAVKRHFREMDKDIQTEPFTVAGVGDMSGDVFGNGMLLSPATRLVAAFDHRHIFLDPSPDPAVAFAERKRLFALPTSSWADYDANLLSWGGGIFPRSAKSVALTPEIRALLEIEDEALAPADLIRAILKAPVELLYFGGIGCYVKAPTESNAEVMDKANDAVRVDGPEVRAKVVGEGANLGVTQAGRIAYARAGGRINTDAIDNSAGVDTSDHEVNIKILLRAAERSGKLKPEDRLELLSRMTEEVGEHVLVHNYAQTLTLSLQEATAAQDIDAHARFMDDLAARGRLDRGVEGLPSVKAMAELKTQGSGLTRPELAVLTAYGKLELSADLEAGAAPDDPWFEQALEDYFPTALGQFPDERRGHQLRREIIATVISNAMVDMCGPTFPFRMKAALGAEPGLTAASFEGARKIFRLDEIWAEIGALDLKISADAQTRLYLETARVLRAQAFWIASKAVGGAAPAIGPLIERYRPCADALRAAADAILSPFEREQAEARRTGFIAAGAPEALARRVAALGPLTATIEAADLAQALEWPAEAAAQLLHATGAAFGFDRLKAAAAALPRGDLYERMALRRLIAEFIAEQTQIARSVAAAANTPPKSYDSAAKLAAAWTAARHEETDRALAGLKRMETDGEPWTFARLTLANAALRDVANS